MVCYRRHGHNEGDDPSYTQPLMYKRIDARRSVRKLYTEALVKRGDISHRGGRAGARRLPGPAPGGARRRPAQHAPPEGRRGQPRRRRRSACCPTSTPASTGRSLDGIYDVMSTPPEGFTRPPEAGQAVRGPHEDVPRGGRGRLGARRGASPSARCCSRAPTSASPARTPGGARSPTATPCWSTTRPRPSGRRSPTSTPTRPSSGSTTRCCRSTPRSASSTATRSPTRTRSWCGRRSSATSSTAPRSSSTSTSSPPRTSGARPRASCCCCPTATRARAPSTRRPASSGSSRCAPRTTSRSPTPPPPAQYFHLLRRQMHARRAQAAGRLHAQVAAAGQAGPVAGRRAHRRARSRRCSTTRRAPATRPPCSGVVLGSGKVGHDAIAAPRRDGRAGRRRSGSSSSTRGRSTALAEALSRLPERRRARLAPGGAREHGPVELRQGPALRGARRPLHDPAGQPLRVGQPRHRLARPSTPRSRS